jgi:hypothetical protein
MAIYRLSTGNLLVTLTAWSPNGLVEGQIQIEPECSEYTLLAAGAVPMSQPDEAAFRLLRTLRNPFDFVPWRRRRRRTSSV